MMKLSLFLALNLSSFVHSETCGSALWVGTTVNMGNMRDNTTVSASSEIMCAAMALSSDHSVYCYDGKQCVHGPLGGSEIVHENPDRSMLLLGGTTEKSKSSWKCKTNRGNCLHIISMHIIYIIT